MRMDRSGFLKMFAALPAAALSLGSTSPRGYQRTQPKVGYLDADGAAGVAPYEVDKVTVDGVEVDGVFELNDAEGWVRRWPDGGDKSGAPIERIEGEVEVWWRGAEDVAAEAGAEGWKAHHEVSVTAEPGMTGKELVDRFTKEMSRRARATGSSPLDALGDDE